MRPDDLRAPVPGNGSRLRKLDAREVPRLVAPGLDARDVAHERAAGLLDQQAKLSGQRRLLPAGREGELGVAARLILDGLRRRLRGRERAHRIDARELVGELAEGLGEEVLEIVARAAGILQVDAALALRQQRELLAIEGRRVSEADGHELP